MEHIIALEDLKAFCTAALEHEGMESGDARRKRGDKTAGRCGRLDRGAFGGCGRKNPLEGVTQREPNVNHRAYWDYAAQCGG